MFNVCLETKYNCFEVRIMFVATLDPLKVGKIVAFFSESKKDCLRRCSADLQISAEAILVPLSEVKENPL